MSCRQAASSTCSERNQISRLAPQDTGLRRINHIAQFLRQFTVANLRFGKLIHLTG